MSQALDAQALSLAETLSRYTSLLDSFLDKFGSLERSGVILPHPPSEGGKCSSFKKTSSSLRLELAGIKDYLARLAIECGEDALRSLAFAPGYLMGMQTLAMKLDLATERLAMHDAKLAKARMMTGPSVSSRKALPDVDRTVPIASILNGSVVELTMVREDIFNPFRSLQNTPKMSSKSSTSGRSKPTRLSAALRMLSLIPDRDALPGDSAIRMIHMLFKLHPFNTFNMSDMTLRRGFVDRLRLLNEGPGMYRMVGRHIHAMEALGRHWVDEKIQVPMALSVTSVARVHVDLSKALLQTVTNETANFTPDAHAAAGTSPEGLKQTKGMPIEFYTDDPTRLEWMLDMRTVLQDTVARASADKLSIAFCGMVKAGKSLFLNAFIGQMVLPSGELPSTAWPCRVRHIQGQTVPSLTINTRPFQIAIFQLRQARYSELMSQYQPQDSNPFASIIGSDSCDGHAAADEDDPMEIEKRMIYDLWIDLHATTKKNLQLFETQGFCLPACAKGVKEVEHLLGQINDIVRLCRRFRLPFTGKSEDWPILTIEFDSLRDRDMDCVFEFIDLPGIGEFFKEFSFEELIREAAREVDAIVPIVAFKEIAKSDWRQLSEVIKAGTSRPPDLVVCTHLDQVSRDVIGEQIASVAKVFWPNTPGAVNRVLACSSLMGISATALRRRSDIDLPRFGEFWDKGNIEYDCAEKILGAWDPEQNYSRMSLQSWKSAVSRQLVESGLRRVIARLTTDIVIDARQRLLMRECKQLSKPLKRCIKDLTRVRLEMRRSREEYESAYKEFKQARRSFEKALDEWTSERIFLQATYSGMLHKALSVLEDHGLKAATAAVANAVKKNDRSLPSVDDPNTLVFNRKSDVESFLQTAQRGLTAPLERLKRQYVGLVRQLSARARGELLATLKQKIEMLVRDGIVPDLKDDIVEDLEDYNINLETVMLQSIRREVVHVVKERYGPISALMALEQTFATRYMLLGGKLKLPSLAALPSQTDDQRIDNAVKRYEQLGMAVRAPFTAIAIIPWILGAGIWPFITRAKKYHLRRDKIETQLQARVVRPFLEALKSEGESTLDGVLIQSYNIAKSSVVDSLEKEERRYSGERIKKGRPPSMDSVAAVLVSLSNFVAADAALSRLFELLA